MPLTSKLSVATAEPLNQILFGPPGTGKTYATVNKALAILDPELVAQVNADTSLDDDEKRNRLKQRFDELHAAGRLYFTTFHQSFSYEDFVEGIRAVCDEQTKQLDYQVVDGVFKSLCEVAQAKATQLSEQDAIEPFTLGKRRIWKMSLGNTQGEDAVIYDECVEASSVLLGYGDDIDFSGCLSREDVRNRYAQAGVVLDGPYDYRLTSVVAFVTKMKVGDLVVVSEGNSKFRAIAEITGNYEFSLHPSFDGGYSQKRAVKWLRRYTPSLPHTELLDEGRFSQMTLYAMQLSAKAKDKLKNLLNETSIRSISSAFHAGQMIGKYQILRVSEDVLVLKKPVGTESDLPIPMQIVTPLLEYVRAGSIGVEDIRQKQVFEKIPNAPVEKFLVNGYPHVLAELVAAATRHAISNEKVEPEFKNYVLIIDEINRGNISRIFGELITLLEPSKRAGAAEALSVTLPYSKESFSVPSNVHIIGTMNTTDRSLAGLDVALRRRFVFEELMPYPQVLQGMTVAEAGVSVNVQQLLETINERIEALLDREHQIGHAYFMPLRDAPTRAQLAQIFKNQILPLLQEYFFDDWERISWILNDHQKPEAQRFVQKHGKSIEQLFGKKQGLQVIDKRWRINPQAFESLASFAGVIEVQPVTAAIKTSAEHQSAQAGAPH